MRKSGEIDEAFRSLKEFADLCPDQDDIRIMLADQLARDDRKEEAVEQLQLLYEKTMSEGRTTEAKAVLDRMRAIDPSVVPSTGKTPTSTPRAPSGLQFLMPDDAPPVGEHPRTPAPTPQASRRFTPLESKAIGGLPLIHPDVDDIASEPVEGIERASAVDEEEPLSATPVSGLETAFYDAEDDPGQIVPLDDLELTAHQDEEALDDFSAITPEDELPEDEDGGAVVDLPMLLPDDAIVPVDEHEADDHSRFIPEVESDEPEPIVLEVEDEPFQLEHSEDDLPLLGSDDAYAASEPELQEPDSPWASEQMVDDGRAVALEEPPESNERLTARIVSLRARIAEDPGDPELLRGLGEALIEAGERDEGIAQLEGAIWELERMGAFGKAYALANEILRVDPDAVRFHQKRVEFAFRTGEKPRLVEAYLGLADSLVRGGEVAKARVVYQRVIDLSPDDARARVALDTITDASRPATPPAASVTASPAPPATPPASPAAAPPVMPLVQQKPDERPVTPRRPSTPPAGGVRPSSRPTPVATEFINLAAWMDEDEQKKSTRMVAEGVTEPENEAQADFADMLERFKEGVAANLDEGDFQSHYDLGIAYREMGLLDEAIAEFQKALRSTDDRVKTYEALGQCFIEKQHYPIAITLLARALSDGRKGDETLIGVLYMLGSACEAVGRHAEARGYYERVYAVDIRFRDVNDRLAAVAQVTQ
jgi:tetratricopeptide (TPR) repeat protein